MKLSARLILIVALAMPVFWLLLTMSEAMKPIPFFSCVGLIAIACWIFYEIGKIRDKATPICMRVQIKQELHVSQPAIQRQLPEEKPNHCALKSAADQARFRNRCKYTRH